MAREVGRGEGGSIIPNSKIYKVEYFTILDQNFIYSVIKYD
jgi:hypothetical protein